MLAKGSCNKTVISLGSLGSVGYVGSVGSAGSAGSAVARSAVLQISVTTICSAFRRLVNIQGLWIVFRYRLAGTKTSEEL